LLGFINSIDYLIHEKKKRKKREGLYGGIDQLRLDNHGSMEMRQIKEYN
jgi:hypothetical protein